MIAFSISYPDANVRTETEQGRWLARLTKDERTIRLTVLSQYTRVADDYLIRKLPNFAIVTFSFKMNAPS